MSNLLIANAFVCVAGFLMGVYTFIKHLKVFSVTKTPVTDAWLVSIGMLTWSIMLYASFNEPIITHLEVLSRFLLLVYWVGGILRVQKYCARIRRRFARQTKI